MKKLRGKAWVFGDILDVDFDICPIEATRSNRPRSEKDYGKFFRNCVHLGLPVIELKGDKE